MKIENLDRIERCRLENKSAIIIVSHYADYEVASNIIPRQVKQPCVFVYRPQKNKWLDKLLILFRSRKNAILVSVNDIYRY